MYGVCMLVRFVKAVFLFLADGDLHGGVEGCGRPSALARLKVFGVDDGERRKVDAAGAATARRAAPFLTL